jgi:signal transduction histidine kinase
MAAGPTQPTIDAKWPKLLSLAAHEFRSPLTVVAGYIRMLLKERAGPVPEQQRRLLEEAEKSCVRLSQLLTEVSELAHLEAGSVSFSRSAVDVRPLLADAIADLPDLRDRTVAVELAGDAAGQVHGDPARLKNALAAIVIALRRELVTSELMHVRLERASSVEGGAPVVRITVGEADRMPRLLALADRELGPFDEWRGGNGLSLANARRIIEAHGGALLAPLEDGKASAIVSLPGI